jgi:predicted unusual protein kinase regulating ubiquinone biosynthesis (AarF/ABC1/UbiB family)
MIQWRYRRILWFFARVILSVIAWDILLPSVGLRRWARRTRPERYRRWAVAFRTLAVEMGGVMIKVGQFLSSRLDVLPREITNELAGLQDEVRPETFAAMRSVIEAEFNAPLESVFADFQEIPLASASIGQVHRACVIPRGGESPNETIEKLCVIVKVQRPDIPQVVQTDLAALRIVSGWVDRYPPVRKHANVPGLMEEFSRSLHEEIDYLNEGKNAETFAANFKDRPGVRVPFVVWSHTTRRVLTLEYIEAIKVTDYAAIDAAGIDRVEVAERLLDTYLKQIFEDRFFHADPHPGNLFVLPLFPSEEGGARPWKLVFVDFGMTGKITARLQQGLREAVIAVGTQDAARLIHAYQVMDFLLPQADIELLERASGRAFERFWGKSTSEMVNMHREEATAFIREFGDLIYEMPFQVPENIILLGRCLGILSGMCSGLNPDFNLWTSIAPYARKMIESEGGGVQGVLREVLSTLQLLVSLPRKTESLLKRIEQGKVEVRSPELNQRLNRLERGQRRLAPAVIFTAFLLGGVQLYLAGSETGVILFGAGAGLALLWVIIESRN